MNWWAYPLIILLGSGIVGCIVSFIEIVQQQKRFEENNYFDEDYTNEVTKKEFDESDIYD